jgi:hypothetical protein
VGSLGAATAGLDLLGLSLGALIPPDFRTWGTLGVEEGPVSACGISVWTLGFLAFGGLLLLSLASGSSSIGVSLLGVWKSPSWSWSWILLGVTSSVISGALG